MQKEFTFHMEYAGDWIHEKVLGEEKVRQFEICINIWGGGVGCTALCSVWKKQGCAALYLSISIQLIKSVW